MSEKTTDRLLTLLTWVFRILLGAVFTYSGFVKAIDPYGTLYKMSDYLGAMGIDILPSLLLVGVFLLCGYEFMIGVFFLTGSYRRTTPLLAALLMALMTPLTLWLAIANPISDCGCFGDAWKLSNWATFWKNILICLSLVFIWNRNRRLHWIITPALQWIGLVVTGLFVAEIEWLGYVYQPLIDFREYRIGEPLLEEVDEGYEPEFVFIYEKDGQRREFSINDELPDENDGWVFVDRKEISAGNPDHQKSKALTLFSTTDEEDMTAEAYLTEGPQIMLMMPALQDVAIASSYKINSFYDWSRTHGIDFIAVVNASEQEIENWRDISMASYPIYLADDTAIEEVVRGNPAVVYLKNGIVVWKSTLQSILVDDFMEEDYAKIDAGWFARDNGFILFQLTALYIIIIVGVILVSFLPMMIKNRKFFVTLHFLF